MKMKRIIAAILMVVLVFGLVACGKKNEDNGNAENNEEPKTYGGKLEAIFKKEAKDGKKVAEIMEALMNEETAASFNCMLLDDASEYIFEFNGEIKNYTSVQKFSPMIGSIPFVVYVFESSDAEALKKDLLANANPRWNICTEAAETVCSVSGNLVFFAMLPSAEDLAE